MKKIVEIDSRAAKELKSFSDEVQAKAAAAFEVLEQDGYLKEPYGK